MREESLRFTDQPKTENGKDNQVLNNIPPDVREDFNITQREGEIDWTLMPDLSVTNLTISQNPYFVHMSINCCV